MIQISVCMMFLLVTQKIGNEVLPFWSFNQQGIQVVDFADSKTPFEVVIEGTLDWNPRRGSNVIWYPRMGILDLGELPARDIHIHINELRRLHPRWVILAHAGRLGSVKLSTLEQLNPSHGFLVANRSRVDARIARWIRKLKKPLLETRLWGRLIFQK